MSGPDRIADPKLRKAVVDAGMVSKDGTTARGWELIRQLKEIEGADAAAAQDLIDQAIGRQPFDKPKRPRKTGARKEEGADSAAMSLHRQWPQPAAAEDAGVSGGGRGADRAG